MISSIFVAIIFLVATDNCVTDSCLFEERTIVVKAESMKTCQDILEAFNLYEPVTYSKCEEVALNDGE